MTPEAVVPVKHVSDLAFVVAASRAVESIRQDARFYDPYAELLAGEHGRVLQSRFPRFEVMEWLMALRTAALDELILKLVASGVDTVVNLAAGLDARPYRLNLPPNLIWLEADLAPLMEYKANRLIGFSPSCQLRRIKIDLTDEEARRGFFREIDEHATATLVITEGLLPCLERRVVSTLADELRQGKTFTWWLMDMISPALIGHLRELWREGLRDGGLELPFDMAEGPSFFSRYQWHLTVFRSFEDESRDSGRLPPTCTALERTALLHSLAGSGIALFQTPAQGARKTRFNPPARKL